MLLQARQVLLAPLELLEEQVEQAFQGRVDNKDLLEVQAHLARRDSLDHAETWATRAKQVYITY